MDRRHFLAGSAAFAQTAPPPKAKITSSVMLWTLKGTFEEKMEAAAKAGIQSVQFVGEHTGWDAARIRQVKSLARSLRLTIDTLGVMPNWGREKLGLLDPAQRDRLLKEVEKNLIAARELEVPLGLLMSGNTLPDRTPEQQFQSMIDGTAKCGELAARYGVTLIVEPLNTRVNHKGYFLSNCVDGLKLVQAVNHPNVRLLFDLYHEQVERGDVIRSAQAAMSMVKVFHVADTPGRNEPGTGEMNYANIYKAIAKANYEGIVCMEYLPLKEQVASLTQAVNEMRAALL
jgi:hydroxypyruvate isomerase